MNALEQGEVRVDVVRELRERAAHEADIPELVDFLRDRLELDNVPPFFRL